MDETRTVSEKRKKLVGIGTRISKGLATQATKTVQAVEAMIKASTFVHTTAQVARELSLLKLYVPKTPSEVSAKINKEMIADHVDLNETEHLYKEDDRNATSLQGRRSS